MGVGVRCRATVDGRHAVDGMGSRWAPPSIRYRTTGIIYSLVRLQRHVACDIHATRYD